MRLHTRAQCKTDKRPMFDMACQGPVGSCHDAHHWQISVRLKSTSGRARRFNFWDICHTKGFSKIPMVRVAKQAYMSLQTFATRTLPPQHFLWVRRRQIGQTRHVFGVSDR